MSDGESADLASLQVGDEPVHVTCLLGCHWADDGSDPASGHMTPKAIHAEGCPHSNSRYIETVPLPVEITNPPTE